MDKDVSLPPVLSAEVVVLDRHGLHLRCATEIARLAMGYESRVSLTNGRRIADAKSMLGLATLAATAGSKLKITASGKDAADALKALCLYFDRSNEK